MSVTPRPLPFGDAGAEPDPRGVRDPDPPDRDVSFPQASPVSIRVKSRRVEPPPGDSGSDSDPRADRSLATSRSVPTRSCRSLGCNSSRASSKDVHRGATRGLQYPLHQQIRVHRSRLVVVFAK